MFKMWVVTLQNSRSFQSQSTDTTQTHMCVRNAQNSYNKFRFILRSVVLTDCIYDQHNNHRSSCISGNTTLTKLLLLHTIIVFMRLCIYHHKSRVSVCMCVKLRKLITDGLCVFLCVNGYDHIHSSTSALVCEGVKNCFSSMIYCVIVFVT